MPSSDRQHGYQAGGKLLMCVRGEGLQQSARQVPTAAAERGGGTLCKPAAVGLASHCSDQQFAQLVRVSAK